MQTIERIPNKELIKRIKALKPLLTMQDRAQLQINIEKEYQHKAGAGTIYNYLTGAGSSYWTRLFIVLTGEAIIKNRK
jgi:hypothetical protein